MAYQINNICDWAIPMGCLDHISTCHYSNLNEFNYCFWWSSRRHDWYSCSKCSWSSPSIQNGPLRCHEALAAQYCHFHLFSYVFIHFFFNFLLVILFVFGATHQFMSAWLYRYAFSFGFTTADAYIVISIYWGAFTFTRLIMKMVCLFPFLY